MPTELGIPTNVVKSLAELFPEEMGPSFSKVGLRPNPRDPGFPVEMPVTTMSRKGVKSTLTGEARVLTAGTRRHSTIPLMHELNDRAEAATKRDQKVLPASVLL